MSFEELKALIVDTLSIDEDGITEDAKLSDDLGIDSLDAMEVNMAIEEKLGKSIPNEELAEIVTVGDILKKINE